MQQVAAITTVTQVLTVLDYDAHVLDVDRPPKRVGGEIFQAARLLQEVSPLVMIHHMASDVYGSSERDETPRI